jgi:hypothetical protein
MSSESSSNFTRLILGRLGRALKFGDPDPPETALTTIEEILFFETS